MIRVVRYYPNKIQNEFEVIVDDESELDLENDGEYLINWLHENEHIDVVPMGTKVIAIPPAEFKACVVNSEEKVYEVEV